MEGNGTQTKYMHNSAISGQRRPSPVKNAMQSEQNMTLPERRPPSVVPYLRVKK